MRVDLFIQTLTQRKGFLIGLAASLAACTLLATAALMCGGKLSALAQGAADHIYTKVNPIRIDLEAAAARLRQVAGPAIVCPFPNPKVIVCKEFGELDLFYGERFVKRYRVKLGNPAEGTYGVGGHEVPRGSERLTIGLSGCAPTSATAAIRVHAGAVQAGQGALNIVGIKDEPAAPGPAGTEAGEIAMREPDAAEVFAAIGAGNVVLIDK